MLTVGSFLLTMELFYLQMTILSFFAYNWSSCTQSVSFFTCNWSFYAYSGKVHLIRAFRDCKQRSLTVSKKTPTVSKKASPICEAERAIHEAQGAFTLKKYGASREKVNS